MSALVKSMNTAYSYTSSMFKSFYIQQVLRLKEQVGSSNTSKHKTRQSDNVDWQTAVSVCVFVCVTNKKATHSMKLCV